YTDQVKAAPADAVATAAGATSSGTDAGSGNVSNTLVLGALALIFVLLVVMLFLVYGTLKRIAEAQGVDTPVVYHEKRTPIWKAFIQNQFLVIVVSIFFILA